MKKITRWALEEIDLCEISATDLYREGALCLNGNVEVECYGITFYDRADQVIGERAELLWIPSHERGGIAWGADAAWTDADNAEDAVRRFVRDEIIG